MNPMQSPNTGVGKRLAESEQEKIKCSCAGCIRIATHTWSGHPTCDECGTPARLKRIRKINKQLHTIKGQ